MWWSDSYHEDLPLEVFMARLLGNSAVVPQVFEQPQIRLLQINWITDFCVVFPQIALAIGVLTPSVGVRVHRFFGFYLGGLSGRVWSEVLVVSSDVRLVVHMSECTQIFWICLWGATRFFNVMMQHFYFVFAAALLQFTTQGNTVKGRVKNN